jgi:hypothetical protein
MEHLNCRGYNELDKRVSIVETKQTAMESDITEIKKTLKENRIFTITILASTLVSAGGVIVMLLGG